jgi:hypothetical protein
VAVVCGKNLPLLMGLTDFMGDAEAGSYENLYPNIRAFMMDDRVKAVLAATAGQAPRLTSGRDSAPTKTPAPTKASVKVRRTENKKPAASKETSQEATSRDAVKRAEKRDRKSTSRTSL